jgi:hypothetical protein
MKTIGAFGLLVGILMAWCSGCAGTGITKPAKSDLAYIDTWLEKDAFKKIVEQLTTNSFMKGKPFIIVKAEGEVVSNRIDKLSEEIRERLVSALLEYPEIKLVRKHPAQVIDRPYKLQDLKCNRYVEHEMLLTIDIKPVGPVGDDLVKVNIRAIDRKKDTWVGGFSIHKKVVLAPHQRIDLDTLRPDAYLRGLKYVPFTESQADEMAAYLARNLSCIFRDAYSGNDIKVFVDSSKLKRKNKDIAWFMEKQLQICNEIQLINNRENADWVLVAEARETGAGTGLAQFWIEAYMRKDGELVRGLATYAYLLIGEDAPGHISGRWEILNLPSKSRYGYMEITRAKHDFRGNLFGPDGNSLLMQGIVVRVNGKNIDWAWAQYKGDRLVKTFRVKGLLLEDGEKMAVKLSSFPSSDSPLDQELVLVE